MRASDRISATLMHATARFTVRYGDELRFAGTDLPRPTRRRIPTRHGRVTVHEYGGSPGTTGPAYVHFHGGAWLMRYPQMDDWWCRYVAATAGVRVVNVDFRTGPYVTYPVAQHQCHDVAAAIAAEAPVAVGGFSSGGGWPRRLPPGPRRRLFARGCRCSACRPSTWPPTSPPAPG